MILRSGPIFRLLKEMRPDFPFNVVQLNKFRHYRQCQPHLDRRNVGDSLFAMMGDFKGGALKLADGRIFDRKYQWYRYNGASVAHGVEPFTGERISVVLYQDSPRLAAYVMNDGEPVAATAEAAEWTGEHPRVEMPEDPAIAAERERNLAIAKAKAVIEWRQAAAQKCWDLVRAPLDVYRHSGEALEDDPRRTQEYVNQVIEGLRLLPLGPEYDHLTAEDIDAIIEMVKHKAAAFWVPDTRQDYCPPLRA